MARAFLTTIPLTALMLVTSACSSDSEPDVSHAGQIEYACALVSHVAEDAEIEAWTIIGPDTDAGARELATASSLVGASAAFDIPEHEGLSEAGREFYQALTRADPELMEQGLQKMTDECADVSPSSDIDVTEEGQIQYACALADHVTEEHGALETWGGIGADRGWHEAASVGAFFGAANGQVWSEHVDLSDAGGDVLGGFVRMDTAAIESGLQEITGACDEL